MDFWRGQLSSTKERFIATYINPKGFLVALIEAENVVKEYRKPLQTKGFLAKIRTLFSREYSVTRAIDRVSISLTEGEFVGFLGPNGAGKSTMIKMLTGILAPTSGIIKVDGVVPWRNRERNARQIGVVFGQRSQLWWDLPLIESFKIIRKIYNIPDHRYRANLDRFVGLLDMEGFLQTPVRLLSLGQRMRGDLAAAMLHEPRILFLDEPTVGLDVIAKQRMRRFIAELNSIEGATIVLTTHDMDDVERLCHRAVIIDSGRQIYDGQIQALKDSYAPYRDLIVHYKARLQELPILAAREIRREDERVWLRFYPTEISMSRLIREVTERYTVSDLSFSEPKLEDIIADIYATSQTP